MISRILGAPTTPQLFMDKTCYHCKHDKSPITCSSFTIPKLLACRILNLTIVFKDLNKNTYQLSLKFSFFALSYYAKPWGHLHHASIHSSPHWNDINLIETNLYNPNNSPWFVVGNWSKYLNICLKPKHQNFERKWIFPTIDIFSCYVGFREATVNVAFVLCTFGTWVFPCEKWNCIPIKGQGTCFWGNSSAQNCEGESRIVKFYFLSKNMKKLCDYLWISIFA